MTNTPTREWTSDFSTFPQDGTRVELRHSACPGYDTTGSFKDGNFELASFFIRHDMAVLTRPTHWRHLP